MTHEQMLRELHKLYGGNVDTFGNSTGVILRKWTTIADFDLGEWECGAVRTGGDYIEWTHGKTPQEAVQAMHELCCLS